MPAAALPHGLWFRAPWSWSLKVISALATTVLLGVAAAIWITAGHEGGPARWLSTLVCLLIPGLTALCAVRAYGVRGRVLIVQRPGWQSRIRLQGLQEARADPKAMAGSLRLFGNGGLFAFSGWYYNRQLGRYRAFATDPSRAVVLLFKDRRVVVTPDDPEAFIHTLGLRPPRLAG